MKTEIDFLRRSEIGTQQERPRWLQYFLSPAHSANDYIHERGRKVEDVMTRDLVVADKDISLNELVHLMEKNGIKRLPVLRGNKVVGIITRANLLQAVASMAREIPDPTADDGTYTRADYAHPGSHRLAADRLEVAVRNGVVHLHGLIINDDSARRASVVAAENIAGVKEVHNHLCFVDSWSGS